MSITIVINTGPSNAIRSGLNNPKPAIVEGAGDSVPDDRAAELAAKFMLRPTMDDVASETCLESCVMYAKKLMDGKNFKGFKDFFDKLEPHMDQDARDRFRSVLGDKEVL